MTSRDDPPVGFFQIQTQTGWGRTLAAVADFCRAKPGWVCLDLGCGPGLLPGLLAERGCQAVGMDISEGAFQEGRLHQHLVQGDAHFPPFPAHTFDLAAAVNLLFLLPDPLVVMEQIRRVLKPGGQAVLLNPSERLSTVSAADLAERRGLQGPARQSLLNWARLAENHYRWTEEDLDALLSSAGLRTIEFKGIVGDSLARLVRAEAL
jgi:SAM-dependent methyltransferase